MVAVLVAVVAIWLTRSGERSGSPTKQADTSAPTASIERGPVTGLVAIGDTRGELRVVNLGDGGSTVVSENLDGYPAQPIRVGDHVAFVADGEARLIAPRPDSQDHASSVDAITLGAADYVLASGKPDGLWLVRGHPPGPVEVVAVGVDGTAANPIQVPADERPVAPLAGGLLILRSDGSLSLFDIESRTITAELGVASDVLATQGNTVAWLEGPPDQCGQTCRLYVGTIAAKDGGTNLDARIVAPPAGESWIRGGAFGPDGAQLAVFVDAHPDTGTTDNGPGARLVIVNMSDYSAYDTPGSYVGVGENIVDADWSPTTGWLLFSGLRGSVLAYRPGHPAPPTSTGLPARYTFAVL
jgi:hypothetical protein